MEFRCRLDVIVIVCALGSGLILPSVEAGGTNDSHQQQNHQNERRTTTPTYDVFYYTSELVEYSDLSQAEKKSITNLRDEPLLFGQNPSLSYCSIYRFFFKVYEGNQLKSITKIIRTPSRDPKTKLLPSPFGDTIELLWTTDFPECVEYYSLIVEDQFRGRIKTLRIEGGNSSYDVDKLIPCTSYSLTLKTFGKDGRRPHTSQVTETTSMANIELEYFNYSVTKTSSVLFTWNKLEHVERCEGDYFVKLVLDDDYSIVIEQHVPYTENQLVVEGLKPCRRYNVTLNANYFDVVASLGQITAPFARPSNLRYLRVNRKERLLQWEEPEENPHCVLNYTVIVPDVLATSVTTTSFSLDALERCQLMDISVQLMDWEGHTWTPLTTKVYLESDALIGDFKTVIAPVNHDLEVSWTPPDRRRKCQIQYKIFWDGNRIPDEDLHSDHSVVIEDFQYCERHSLLIQMNYKELSRKISKDIYYDGSTAQRVANLSYTYEDSEDSVVILWDKPQGFGNCSFSYLLETNQFQTTVSEETYSIPWENEDIFVEVSIENNLSGSSHAQGITIRAPNPAVKNVKHSNSGDGKTKISWSKPDTNESIKKYVIVWDSGSKEVTTNSMSTTFTKCKEIEVVIYYELASGQTSENATYTFSYNLAPDPVKDLHHRFEFPNYILSWDTSDENINCYKSFIITRSGSSEPSVIEFPKQEYTFSSWMDEVEYKFEVIAMFDDDHKSKSTKHSFTTPGPVKDLKVKANGDGLVDFEWSNSKSDDHTPVEYLVSVNGQNYTTKKTSLCVQVEFCVELAITIVVTYDTGVTKSAPFNKKVMAEPGPVSNIKISWNKNTIQWDVPVVNPSCATTYALKINGESFTATSDKYSDFKWEACAAVTIVVAAQNSEGTKGEETKTTSTAPHESIPKVQNLEANPTDKSLRISWDEPEKSKKCVTGYRVVVWEAESNKIVFDHENNTMFVVLDTKIKACETLTVQVTPLSTKGDGMLDHITTTIQERAPAALTPVQSVEIHSRSLKLSSSFDDDLYKCALKEVRMTCVDSYDVAKIKTQSLDSVVPEKNLSFELLVEHLQPFERYTCFATVMNTHGSISPSSFNMTIQTLEDVSDPPVDLKVEDFSHEHFRLTWKDPLKPYGKVSHYQVVISEQEPCYYVPEHCLHIRPKFHLNTTVVNLEFLIRTEIRPSTNYEVSVQAVNGAGLGAPNIIFVETRPFVPEPPLEFKLEEVRGPFDTKEYNGSAVFSWKFPCFLNGPFEAFAGILTGAKTEEEPESIFLFLESEIKDSYEVEVVNLKPSREYKIELTTSTNYFKSDSAKETFTSLAAIPDFVATTGIALNMSLNPSQGAVLEISRRNLINAGNIQYYSVLISELDCQPEPIPDRQVLDPVKNWPQCITWSEVQNDNCQRQYQATIPHSKFDLGKEEDPETEPREEADEFIQIEIGNEDCTSKESGDFCNGPLKAGTRYAVVLRLFTESGYADNAYVVLQTISEIQLALIVLSIFTIMCSALVGGLILILRKRNRDLLKECLNEGVKKSSGVGDILTKNFPEHFDDLSKNNCERLNMEFNIINSGGQSPSTAFAVARQNGPKNRYTNVLPYDFNRVILDKTDEDRDSDYINASFINGFRKPREYIASQGPKMDSSYDFWRMILQFKVSSVVMLTSYREGDKDKCHEYFPSNVSETLQFSDIKIRCQKEMDFPTHKKRIFVIEKHHINHTVYHYHFLKWPDHSCPSDPNDLIDFTKAVAAERKYPTHPMIVHCSAGVGRTGTFIALDIALQQVRSEKKINVLEIVKDLRRQRMKMVQSFSQYLLIYQCIVIILKQQEAVHSEPMWKRLSRKANLGSGSSAPRMVNFGTHNFGVLQLKTRKSQDNCPIACPAVAAELLGTTTTATSSKIDCLEKDLDMKTVGALDSHEYPSCFEPEDSIS